MDNWRIVSLGQVCSIDKVQCSSSNLPYVGMEDIEGGTGKFLGSIEPKTVKSSTFRFTPNHLLYGRLRPYLNKVMLPDFEGHCSSEIFPIAVNNSLERSFLFYWLTEKQTVERINRTSTGARMPRANVKEILKFEFPLPPIAEQKRIVAILDEAFEGIDAAIANTEKNLANARELFESYLNAIFTRKGDDWVDKTVGEISEVVSGYSFKSEDFSGSNSLKSIKITNVGVKEFVVDSDSYLPEEFAYSYKRFAIPSGSIVIALTRTIISSGLKVAIVPDEYHLALLNQRVASIKVDQKVVLQQFLFSYLCTNQVVEYVQSKANTLMQPNLSINDLKRMLVPVPSLEEQSQIISGIGNLYEKVQRLEGIYQQKLTALNELKQSILQKAFSGELTAEVSDAAGLGAKEVIAA